MRNCRWLAQHMHVTVAVTEKNRRRCASRRAITTPLPTPS